MRVTNNMITRNTKSNINYNKISVDKYNTQMTTQKKISKPSEDPVVAIRSLRLGTSLAHVNQYVDNNIPDAEAWLDVTFTALNNMKKLLTDIRTQCVNGSTDSLTADDRDTILKALNALSDQIYSEGNADYAGRTVFTGYRTTSNLTFDTKEEETKYQITEKFTFEDIKEHRYYSGTVDMPSSTEGLAECDTTIAVNHYQRLRLAYGNVASPENVSYSINGTETSLVEEGVLASNVTIYESEEAWEKARDGRKTLEDDEVIFIQDSGEFVFGEDVSNSILSGKGEITVNYTKTGFEKGEVRPEYYFDCIDITDPANTITYTKEDQPINYTIANSTTLTVNTQASQVFDTSIARDVDEMTKVVQKSIDAHAKVDKLKVMMSEVQYAGEEEQALLQSYLDVAQKEADYADDNLQKTYEQYITNFNEYLEQVNIGITNIGSMTNRLSLTQTRVENQQTMIQELKSTNEDRDISDIIIDYYASYNAYQSSLVAASKVGQQTLLSYL